MFHSWYRKWVALCSTRILFTGKIRPNAWIQNDVFLELHCTGSSSVLLPKKKKIKQNKKCELLFSVFLGLWFLAWRQSVLCTLLLQWGNQRKRVLVWDCQLLLITAPWLAVNPCLPLPPALLSTHKEDKLLPSFPSKSILFGTFQYCEQKME